MVIGIWGCIPILEVRLEELSPPSCLESPKEPKKRPVLGHLSSLVYAAHRKEPGA